MRIASLQKQSFIDWEGRTVAVIFTKGCNFRCGYCHNPSLVLSHLINQTPDIPEQEIFDYLESRKGWLDGIVVSGGEPTLHNDLPEFLHKIKALGYAIKLDTNGSNPMLLKQLISDKLIDFVAMDVKTITEADYYYDITKCSNPELINLVKSSIAIIRNSGLGYQFRTTIIDEHHTTAIKDWLLKEFENENFCLQDFKNGITIESELCKVQNELKQAH